MLGRSWQEWLSPAAVCDGTDPVCTAALMKVHGMNLARVWTDQREQHKRLRLRQRLHLPTDIGSPPLPLQWQCQVWGVATWELTTCWRQLALRKQHERVMVIWAAE